MKNKSKKIGFAGLLVTPAIVSVSCIYATSCTTGKVDDDSTIHLLDINDFHGAAVGYGDPNYPLNVSNKNPGIERIAKTYDSFLKTHPNTAFLSAGDNSSSECFSSTEHGATLYPLLKALNIRHSAVGNHAFEWGMEYMSGEGGHDTFEKWAKPDDEPADVHYFLAANILSGQGYQDDDGYEWHYKEDDDLFERDYGIWNTNRVKWADPAATIDVGGHTIGLIGLTTQATRQDGNQKVVQDLSFINYIASINFAKHWLKSKPDYGKIEAWVLLTHVESGQDETTGDVNGACADIARDVDTPISAIISGHSHKDVCGWVRNKHFGRDIWIGQANTAGRAILDTTITFSEPDESGKCKIEKVGMELIHPHMQNSSLSKARSEILSIRSQARNRKDGDLLKNVIDEYYKQSDLVIKKFKKEIEKSTTTGEIYPLAADRAKLGHTYLWPSDVPEAEGQHYAIEQMGGWINYAQLEGFKLLTQETGNALTPSVCFTSLDSITSGLATKNGERRPITYGDIYQAQTYENNLFYGYLTVGQLANIAQYSLAGRRAFNYEDNPNYKDLVSLGLDFVTNKPIDNLTKITTCKYLCGPLQMWGMSFKTDIPRDTRDRDRSLSYSTEGDLKFPRMKIYSPKPSDNNDIRKPDTWKDAKDWYDTDKFIPVLISSFTWSGGNNQNTMFKNYMEANAKTNPSLAVQEFTWKTTDAIFKFLESINDDTQDIDLSKEIVHSLVQW